MAEAPARNNRSVLGIPAAALAALPLCPACYPAYAGILSALGLTVLSDTTVQTALTLVFLSAALGAAPCRSHDRAGRVPDPRGAAQVDSKIGQPLSGLPHRGLPECS